MVDVKEKVMIGGIPQLIHVKGVSAEKPILLILHGGPGGPNRYMIMVKHPDLFDDFLVVGWDQRGSGGSYYKADPRELTISRYVEDAAELIEYLCKRFNKEKVFVCGASWGSLLGVKLAAAHPEHIYAFVGQGQFINGELNEKLCYEFCVREAAKAGNQDDLRALADIGAPVMGQYKGGYKAMIRQRGIMTYYGGGSPNTKGKRPSGLMDQLKVYRAGKEMSYSDIMGMKKGAKMVIDAMWPEIGRVDLVKENTKFEIPMFIFDGKLDMNTPAELVPEWFDKIEAPVKELIWFENSGHNPLTDESDKFKKLLREKLLPLA